MGTAQLERQQVEQPALTVPADANVRTVVRVSVPA
jgi:hypothetical protein